MDNHHGAPEDGMGSETEGGGGTAPGLGLSAAAMNSVGQPRGKAVSAREAAGTGSDIAAKIATLGTSTGSKFKIRKKYIH